MSAATPSLSVVICSRDRPEFLREALAEFSREELNSADGGAIELVVVDSASKTPETAAVAANYGIAAIRCELPGLSRARNVGFAAATGDLVAFTDDDCFPTLEWARRVRGAFADPQVGVVTGPVHADRATKQAVSVDERDEDFAYAWGSDPAKVGHGANMTFRRTALEQAGAFDPMLGAGSQMRSAEDIDMIWRVLRAGWTGRFDAAAVISHRQWRSTWQAVRMAYGYGLGTGSFAVKAHTLQPGVELPTPARKRVLAASRNAARHLRRGYQSGAAAEAFFAYGVLRGASFARRRAIEADVFVDELLAAT